MERRMPKRHVQQTQPAPAKKMAKNISSFAFFAGLSWLQLRFSMPIKKSRIRR